MLHKLAIITVVYENYTVLEDFLKSLHKQNNKNFHLFVIDVSIHRNTITYSEIAKDIIYSENRGYSHGINVGLKSAIKQKYYKFCILNNDTYFKEDFIGNAFSSIKKHPGSIIGGKIYYAPGYEYHKESYEKEELGKVIWYAGGYFDWDHVLTPHRGVDKVDKDQYNRLENIDFVNGALMLFDKTVIDRVGFWDEGYFLYYEDADFSIRAKQAGIKLYYDPLLVIWHKNSQSTGGSGSLTHQKYQRMNRLRFGLKYAPIKTKLHLIKNYILKR